MGQHSGRDDGPEQLLPVVYEELHRLAAAYMRGERPDHTLQPTALVHEAYLRLTRNRSIGWKDRTHVVAMAAIEMRRVLVDHARRKKAHRRGGGWTRVSLGGVTSQATTDLLVLEEALERLQELSPRQCSVATLRVYGDLQEREIAEHLAVSERTVREDWRLARAWLRRALSS